MNEGSMNDYSSVCEGCECQDHELKYHKQVDLMLCYHCFWVADQAQDESDYFENNENYGGTD